MVVDDAFGVRERLDTPQGPVTVYALDGLRRRGVLDPARLPYSLRVLLENVLRHQGRGASPHEVEAFARWPERPEPREVAFVPARVLLQDLTGVPAIVDLAALRDAVRARGGDPARVDPRVPVDLVIDHSVQVDAWGSGAAFETNVELEFARNRERYALLSWAQAAFRRLRVVPPGTGIVHQVNLEYLARVVEVREEGGEAVAFPDSLVGTDSHTTMINGIGVLGWGVGGIEAEAAMLGEPYVLELPEVVGVRLVGRLGPGATATDLVLTVTERLRRHGVVGKFVEFFGPGLDGLTVPDRATIANMAPEYGATVGFFPVDGHTLRYLRETGRPPELVALVEAYCRSQGLFREAGDPEPVFTEVLELDLAAVEPSVAGPRLPQDRLRLAEVPASLRKAFPQAAQPVAAAGEGATGGIAVAVRTALDHGAVAIAAITSCTNTSNPSVMVAAGLLARRAVERGLRVPPYVKTSMAPGSRVVTQYLERAGLQRYLDALGFQVVGYGCTTCIGNSGEITPEAQEAARRGVVLAAVLSGNRNFEGRINPWVRANYLASPPLVVAYALAGTVTRDLTGEPLGEDAAGRPVYLRDLWPSAEEVRDTIARVVDPGMYQETYRDVFTGDRRWQQLRSEVGAGSLLFPWDPASTYIRRPPFLDEATRPPEAGIRGARVLVFLGDSVTTDHISPAGAIPKGSPAAQYLQAHGVAPRDFHSYGARRGNHEVMVRGTFANVRLRNRLVAREGGYTRHLPDGEEMTVFDAAEAYRREGVPLLVLAGREYGTGSSRDWAAKGPKLLGVQAVLAVGFERIHRSNLVGMGILPLEFLPGQDADALGLTGEETYDISWESPLRPRHAVEVAARRADGTTVRFRMVARLDTPRDVACYAAGGILPQMVAELTGS